MWGCPALQEAHVAIRSAERSAHQEGGHCHRSPDTMCVEALPMCLLSRIVAGQSGEGSLRFTAICVRQ